MGAFEYQALNRDAQAKRGVVQADTPRQARAALRDQGLIPLEVKPIAVTQARRRHWGAGKERVLIFRQLATLLRAGMTLEEVLTLLTDQSDRSATRNVMGAIRSRVLEGHGLSKSMAEHPALFPRLYWSSVAAGERTGKLEEVLHQLADHAKNTEAMGRSLGLALVYPGLLLVISLLVVGALIGFVVPRVVGVFEQAGQALPWITESLLFVADGVARFGLIAFIGVAALFGFVAWMLQRTELKLRFHRALFRVPVLGAVWSAQQTALMARTLAILTGSAVPLVEALKVSAGVLGNRAASQDMEQVAMRVSEGVSLSKAMSSVDWVSSIAKRLIHAGEKSGELAPMLQQCADMEERSLASAQSVVLSVIQPLLILLVGLVVLYIVLAIMLPILNMSQLLGGP